MNRQTPSALVAAAVTALAVLAAAVIVSMPAHADDITVEQSAFVSNRTREEVSAELKTPYVGGNPWSSTYNMFQGRSNATSEQVQGEYIKSRDQSNAWKGEDSGSAYVMKAPQTAPAAANAMGAPAR